MILIISDENDHSTNEVIKWLLYLEEPFIRLGQNKFINSIQLKIIEKEIILLLDIDGISLNYKDIKSFWYRKHCLELFKDFKINHEVEFDKNDYFTFLFLSELNCLKEYLVFLFERKKYIGNHDQRNANKLISFYNANAVGLKIPNTLISNKIDFFKNIHPKEEYIIKPIQDLFVSNLDIETSFSSISPFNENYLDELESDFFPSCIQKYIDKKIELRVFYLDNEMYTMAIFSQLDDQTKLDFRNYNFNKPNRCVPYILPIKIKNKIKKFMKLMKLNTGSLDFILTNSNEYIFLEVNPSGQYGMIELNCFYNLDKLIATKLI